MANQTILRQLVMLKIIPKYPAFILTKELAQRLEIEGFKVSLRTVQRDLQNLQLVFSLYSEESSEGIQWCYAKVNTELLPNMQPSEALLLVMAEEILKKSMPIEPLNALEPRLEKARATLNSCAQLRKWKDKISIIQGTFPMSDCNIKSDIPPLVYDAVLKEEKVEVLYQKREHLPAVIYTLNPLGIIVRDYNQYLVASKEESPRKSQLFLINKIHQVVRLYESIPSGLESLFYKGVTSNQSGYILEESQEITLQVRHAPKRVLVNNQLAKVQKIIKVDDEWSEVTFESSITYDLVGWISQHIQAVKIISPNSLKATVLEKINEGLAINS